MKVIVVGVDGSDSAARAAARAADLAAAMGTALYVVTAYGSARAEAALKDSAADWQAAAQEAARATASECAAELSRDFPGLAISTGAAHGKPHTVLVDEAARLNAEMIVVGNRRLQGMQRVLGSVASAVAHRAPCDVYIAHTHG